MLNVIEARGEHRPAGRSRDVAAEVQHVPRNFERHHVVRGVLAPDARERFDEGRAVLFGRRVRVFVMLVRKMPDDPLPQPIRDRVDGRIQALRDVWLQARLLVQTDLHVGREDQLHLLPRVGFERRVAVVRKCGAE